MVGVGTSRKRADLEHSDAIVGLRCQLRELMFGLPDEFLRRPMPIRTVCQAYYGAVETVELPIIYARHFKRAARRGRTGCGDSV